MEELPAELSAFLLNHPFLQLTDEKKVRCSLNGHEFPCNLAELQKFTQGKKYEKLSCAAQFDYKQYEPHVVASSKQPNQLFCKLTLRHLNRQPHHVLKHVNGKRYQKALRKYEECVQQGVDFVPARLQQKRPRSGGEPQKHGNGMWEPSSSGSDDHSDSEDSMSDLYPPSMFTIKKNTEERMEEEEDDGEEEDDFKTDEDEDMEVDKQLLHKRKKVQGSSFQKKFRNNNWRSARNKKNKKAQNGK